MTAVPLMGNQGVYGVIFIEDKKSSTFVEDLGLVSTMADSAGAAFENAKLYEQSNYLIKELRLINEITNRLNQRLQLKDIFDSPAENCWKYSGRTCAAFFPMKAIASG